jgi:hypothetical protein
LVGHHIRGKRQFKTIFCFLHYNNREISANSNQGKAFREPPDPVVRSPRC